MGWTVAVVLRPITFVLAIVAAILTGNRSDSFWYGLLAFFVAMGAGRVLGALIRNRIDRADQRALPVAVQPRVEVDLALHAPVERAGALERVVSRRADQAAGHRREAHRGGIAADRLAHADDSRPNLDVLLG